MGKNEITTQVAMRAQIRYDNGAARPNGANCESLTGTLLELESDVLQRALTHKGTHRRATSSPACQDAFLKAGVTSALHSTPVVKAAATSSTSGASVYRIGPRVAKGGTSELYKATGECGNVAVKILAEELLTNAFIRERFLREGALLCQLTHPKLVRGFATGALGERPFIVMEYVEGHTLAQTMKTRGALPVTEALHIAHDVTLVLNYLYLDGRVSAHRDIKPGNIMLSSNGEVKLIDLGIAKTSLHAKGPLETQFLGSIRYVSPEQIDDAARTDIRSDIYSLGVVLYEMLTGHHAFDGSATSTVLLAHLTAPVPQVAPSDILSASTANGMNDALTSVCNEILRKSMSRDCLNRFQTPSEFLDALNKALNIANDAPNCTSNRTLRSTSHCTPNRALRSTPKRIARLLVAAAFAVTFIVAFVMVFASGFAPQFAGLLAPSTSLPANAPPRGDIIEPIHDISL